jgi:hypothetical protein
MTNDKWQLGCVSQASWRNNQWDDLPPISTIEPKIGVGREYHRVLLQLRHADETGIRQTDRHIAIAPDQPDGFGELTGERKGRLNNTALQQSVDLAEWQYQGLASSVGAKSL